MTCTLLTRGKKGNIITNYLISMYKPAGVLISQGAVESDVSAIDALKVHASSTGRQIEAENLEYSHDKKHWEMYEPDGTRIVVQEV